MTSNRNLMTACQKNLQHGLDIANPFPPDLWGYVHGFGYQTEGSIVPLVRPIESMANLSPPDLVRFRA